MNDEMDPELLDEEVHRMEQERPRRHLGLKYQEIHPALTDEQYSSLKGCYHYCPAIS